MAKINDPKNANRVNDGRFFPMRSKGYPGEQASTGLRRPAFPTLDTETARLLPVSDAPDIIQALSYNPKTIAAQQRAWDEWAQVSKAQGLDMFDFCPQRLSHFAMTAVFHSPIPSECGYGSR